MTEFTNKEIGLIRCMAKDMARIAENDKRPQESINEFYKIADKCCDIHNERDKALKCSKTQEEEGYIILHPKFKIGLNLNSVKGEWAFCMEDTYICRNKIYAQNQLDEIIKYRKREIARYESFKNCEDTVEHLKEELEDFVNAKIIKAKRTIVIERDEE